MSEISPDNVPLTPEQMSNQQRKELIAQLQKQAQDLQSQIIDHTNQLEQIDEQDAQRKAYASRNDYMKDLKYSV